LGIRGLHPGGFKWGRCCLSIGSANGFKSQELRDGGGFLLFGIPAAFSGLVGFKTYSWERTPNWSWFLVVAGKVPLSVFALKPILRDTAAMMDVFNKTRFQGTCCFPNAYFWVWLPKYLKNCFKKV